MARVTVEDCIEKVPNRFGLVLLAGNRARAIANGAALTLDRDNDKNPVVALREIAEDRVVPAELLETGADLSRIIFDLLLSRRIPNAQLWSRALPTLAFEAGERIGSLVVSQQALAQAGAAMPDADGLVEFLFSIQGVQLAVLYKELGPDTFRLSMRSGEGIDAAAIAGVFGGGGPRRAAGCVARLPLHALQAEILAAFLAQASDTSG